MHPINVESIARKGVTTGSRRASLLALTTMVLVTNFATPTVGAAKNDTKKIRKKAKRKCQRQVEQCRAAVVRVCEGLADCEAQFVPCCESFSSCDASSAFACFYPIQPNTA